LGNFSTGQGLFRQKKHRFQPGHSMGIAARGQIRATADRLRARRSPRLLASRPIGRPLRNKRMAVPGGRAAE
jgi:hypothetical protein